MPYYSDDIIEEVRSGNDIVDVISGYVKLHKKGGTYFGLCPFHNEKSPSFSVSAGKQLYYCFGCGAGGNVFTFLMEYENYSFQEALAFLAERIGVTLPKQEMSERSRQEADLRMRIMEMNKLAATYYYLQLQQEQGKTGLAYLKKRGLTEETIKKFGLGYANQYNNSIYQYLKKKGFEDSILKESGLVNIDEKRGGYDRFWNRVMFPIMDQNNRVVGFGGRVMGAGEPKYLNSPETKVFDKSRNLYGIQRVRVSKKSYVLLCEGYMDVIALNQAGFDNAAASLGTAFTPGHAGLLKRYTKEVYLTFDSDSAGIRAAQRAIPILKSAGLFVKVIDMQPYKDPDDFIKALGAEAYEERIKNAQNSFMFEILVMEQDYNLEDPESKTAFYHEAAIKILQFEEEIERNNYMEAFALKYKTGYETFKKLVYSLGNKQLLPERTVLKSGKRKLPREDGMKQSQRLLLTWLIEEPDLFEIVKPYIAPGDFTEEIYYKAAEVLFRHYENEGNKWPQNENADASQAQITAQIVSLFQDKDQQREAAALFHARISDIRTKQEKEKALKETIVRIKQNSIDFRSKNPGSADIHELQKLILDKKQLEELQKLHISIN